MQKLEANERKQKEIDSFLRTLSQSFKTVDPVNFWPLNGGQIEAYFSDTQAAEIYDKINALKKEGLTNQEIGKFFRWPVILRYFLSGYATIGLKVCNVLKIRPFPQEDRVGFTLLLFAILKEMVQDDIFCLNGTNKILSQKDIEKIVKTTTFEKVQTGEQKTLINNFVVSLFQFCNSFYFDIFLGAGLEIHGPYNSEQFFGDKTFLVIRDYFDLKPDQIWPKLSQQTSWPQSIRIMQVFKDTDWKINFFNQPDSRKGIGQHLKFFSVQVNGAQILQPKKIEELDFLSENLSLNQTLFVNKMNPLEQARKGAEIAYYMLREFYTYFGQEPKPSLTVNSVFKRYGDKFIKEFALSKNLDVTHYQRLFDPRNDFIG